MLRRVLVVDQFAVSPFQVREKGTSFEALVTEVVGNVDAYTPSQWGRRPEVREVDEKTFKPESCTTVFAAGPDGRAEVWRHNWDSSG